MLVAAIWIALVVDYTDPVHHNHVANQPIGSYPTRKDCEADLNRQRHFLIGGVVVPKGVIICTPDNGK